MARPPRSAEASAHRVTVRLTAEEAAALRARAAREGTSAADLVRSAALGSPPRRPPRAAAADPALVAQIARIGNNVNQVARRANQLRAVDAQTLLELRSIRAVLAAALLDAGPGRAAERTGD